MLAKLKQAKANNVTLKVSYTTVLFAGSSGVGKTSLLNKLNEDHLNKNHHSTAVAKSKHAICINTVACVKSNKIPWTDLDYDSMINHLNERLRDLQLIVPVDSEPEVEEVGIDVTEDVVDVDIAKADLSNAPQFGDVLDVINFLDTGGQPEFVNILPAVSSSTTLTFIVFNLSKSLDDRVHIQHSVDGNPSFEPYYLDCTNLDFIKRLIVSSENFNKNITPLLQSIQREGGQKNFSKICYVGTHALHVSKEKMQKIDNKLSSIASELKLSQRSFWSSHIHHFKRVFPIDLFPGDREEESFESIIQDIRDNIQDQVQKQDYYDVPITWFIFLLKLQKRSVENKVSYISYKEALDVWNGNVNKRDSDQVLYEDQHESVERDKSDVHNALLFFHFMGMLFYYHEVEKVCDFVFIDRQWLFKKLTELVEIRFTNLYVKKGVTADDIEKFSKEGRLDINIIKNLKVDLQNIEPLCFFNLLDYLNIIAPIDSKLKEYFMPCVLPSFPPTTPVQKSFNLDDIYGSIQHVPLLVGFKNGSLPHGFFCNLIVELFKNLPAGWDPPLQSTSRQQHVYNNLITFYSTTSAHYISFFYKVGYIEVQVRHKKSQPTIIHHNVQCKLDKALRKVSDHLHLTKEQLCYGFYCKCEEIQHFAKLKEFTSLAQHASCGYYNLELTNDHRVWLTKLCGNTG